MRLRGFNQPPQKARVGIDRTILFPALRECPLDSLFLVHLGLKKRADAPLKHPPGGGELCVRGKRLG